MKFNHVRVWIFDLDNTLYDPAAALFAQIERRMTDYVVRQLGVTADQAARLRDDYWRNHGTTLAGLMTEHSIDPGPYLAEVHDIDMSHLRPDPALADAIRALPGRKIIHTNADSAYAGRVLDRRGLNLFDAVWGVEEVNYHPKPDARAYEAVIRAEGIDPTIAAFFEDDPRNLIVPHELGMRTVMVGQGRDGPDELPADHAPGPHVQFRTNDLAAFLRGLL